MPNMTAKKTPIAEQPGLIRVENFEEVTLGYTKEEAVMEADRCLNCKTAPCVQGCPVQVPIPEFIGAVKEGALEEAYQQILKENSFPAICGRVCPQEKQCESKCVRGIKGESVAIGRLERFVADDYRKNHQESEVRNEVNAVSTGKKVAVVGSGPAGLACASELAGRGYQVTIFEALHKLGGVLVYGIPEFRLPKAIVANEIENMQAMGVTIEKNVIVGKSITVEELIEDGYVAIFIGSGAGLPRFLNIPGENANGVYSSNEFLTRVNLMKAYQYPEVPTPVVIGKKVAVVGAGNVAMDCARTAKRLGAEEVSIIYRRSEDEIPARLEEVHHAQEEGILFKLLSNPTCIIEEEGRVKGIECEKMALGEPDASGRRRPVKIEGANFREDMDTVIIAVGQTPNPLLKETTKQLKVAGWGGIIVDEETMETSIENVYAGGDAVTGVATVILAMGAGKKAALAIDAKLGSVGLSAEIRYV